MVAQGETIDSIARRHRVPASAILQANNMTHAAQLRPGQRLVIPRAQQQQQQQIGQAPQMAPPTTRVAGPAQIPSSHSTHTVAPGETIYSLGRHYRIYPDGDREGEQRAPRSSREDRRPRHHSGPCLGRTAPRGARRRAAPGPVAQQQQPAQRIAAAKPDAPAAKPAANPKVAHNNAPPSANLVTPAADPLPETAPTGTTGSSAVSFRWPVKGRISDAFGPKAAGGQNDGINITVPHGTPIKAAEDGVVAYAGSELKGYGNLVLVRHSNGFVTAYAHASELAVKKGETVKRGQVIGKAGQTGNVTSPQLHFEVRKGATPVDPSQYLTGG